MLTLNTSPRSKATQNDLRVVHAYCDDALVEIARNSTDVLKLYRTYEALIESDLTSKPSLDDCDQRLLKQNDNPVKVLTSGKERRADKPFLAGGKLRCEERVCWWEDYRSGPVCVFGHYGLYPDEAPIAAVTATTKVRNTSCSVLPATARREKN